MDAQASRHSERKTDKFTKKWPDKSYKLKDNFEKLVQLKLGIGIPFSKMLD